MQRTSPMKFALHIAAGLFTAALTACGGGGGGGGGGALPVPASTGAPSNETPAVKDLPQTGNSPVESPLEVACASCGTSKNSYSGSGTGIWQGTNNSSTASDFPISIEGLRGQTVTLVLTNESNQAAPLFPIRTSALSGTQLLKSSFDFTPAKDAAARTKAEISEFNRSGFAKLLGPRNGKSQSVQQAVLPQAPLAVGYSVGTLRNIYLSGGESRQVQLAAVRTTGDGTTVNVWVEPTELAPARVSDAIVTRLADSFADTDGIYDMLLKVGGPLWGPHSEAELISGSGQPIDLFFVNFDQNSQPYGLGGYFWSANAFKTTTIPESNESVSMYMDTETLYLDGEPGLMAILTSLAHEGEHMQNFYRRGVSMGPEFVFDTWLDEMTAMMMEDWVSYSLNQSYNAMRDMRFPSYLAWAGAGSYNCSLTNWTPMGAACDSYAVNGSFGAYLNRQLGLDFFRSLLTSTGIEDSQEVLNAAIKARRPASSIGQELRRFTATTVGLVPLSDGIEEYSMPARMNEEGLSLIAIDPAAFGEHMRRLPSSSPSMLQPLASFPVSRGEVYGRFKETVRVPAGTTLTVVVH